MAGDRYTVITERDPTFGVEAFVLHDLQTGSRARVLPSLGNNLMGFAPVLAAGPLEVMLVPATRDGAVGHSSYGSPILFPFPNRIRLARYTFEGRAYQMEINTPEGHHIHGLVRSRPWRVLEATGTPTGAMLRAVFAAADHPDVLRQVPAPFTLAVTYYLKANTLRLTAEARNVGTRAMPMGFGVHPYFRLPLNAAGRPYDCSICVPASRLWVLDHAKMPTGRIEAVPPDLDYRVCRAVGEAELDHVYTGLKRERGSTVCRLHDGLAAADLSVRFGPEFSSVVVYAPADRPTLCFEPYTCVTNAVNLANSQAETGLVILKPGDVWRGGVEYAVAQSVDGSPSAGAGGAR
ncbi:MAG: aldose epimerase family protein [Chloroflexota bacterium]